jgi:hypothetical protein
MVSVRVGPLAAVVRPNCHRQKRLAERNRTKKKTKILKKGNLQETRPLGHLTGHPQPVLGDRPGLLRRLLG